MFFGRSNYNIENTALLIFILLPISIISAYTINYYLIPKFLFQKKYALFIYMLFVVAVLSVWVNILFSLLAWIYIFKFQYLDYLTAGNDIFAMAVSMYLIIFLAVAIKMITHIFNEKRRNQELLKEKLEAELSFLKSQVQPHFLFNTLNNLYALTLQKSDNAPTMVLKLSELLDYMIYQSNTDFLPLQKEIEIIENYIALEKLRYGKRLSIRFQYSKNNNTLNIPPLILLPLVENAFKHGVRKNIQHSWITISLNNTEDRLHFLVENSNPKKANPKQDRKGGIGLQNVKKRLDMIYQDKYVLQINNLEDKYCVKLTINIQ